jgi:hypothetical protein
MEARGGAMRTSIFTRIVVVSLAGFIAIALAACTDNRPQGTYHQSAGSPMVLDFKGDKVTVTLAGDSKTLDYKVDGDKITIVNPQEGDVVFTRNSDGSLNSALGTFVKDNK